MRKIWKYVISSLIVIILAISGTIYYFLNVKTYDVADEKLEEIIQTEYDIVLPDEDSNSIEEPNDNTDENSNEANSGDSSTSSDNGKNTGTNSGKTSTENKTGSNKNETNTNKDNKNNSTSKNNTGNDAKKADEPVVPTVAEIKDKYRPVFESLESQANVKIEALVSRAVGEFNEKRTQDEPISYSYFYRKYTVAGRDLEKKTDETFNYIYTALENNLKKNGYSPSHAKDFKDQYAATKKARETALLNKAKSAL